MKHLNFLSKSSSRSCGHRVTTLALTVGSPSAHRRGAMLRLLSVLVLVLTFGVGNAWGGKYTINYGDSFDSALPSTESAANSTSTAHTVSGLAIKEQGIYKGSSNKYLMFVKNKGFLYNTSSLVTVTSVSATYSSQSSTTGKSYVYFGTSEKSAYTTSSNATIKGQSQTDTWTNSTAGNGYFQLSTSNKNVQITQIVITCWTKVTLDKNGGTADGVVYFDDNAAAASTATGYTFSAASRTGSYTCTGYYTAASGGTKVLNANGTFANANVSGYITNSKWTYAGATLKLYAQWEAVASCTNEITVTKGTPSNGSFSMIGAGTVCIDEGNASVTISNIEPASGYRFKEITATVGTVDNDLKTVTDIDADVTINVVFEEIPSHRVYFYNGTTLLNTGGTSFDEGAAVSYSGDAPTSCDTGTGASTTFAGWATATWDGKVAKNEIVPTFYESTLPVMGNADVTYYAVFCKGGTQTITITNSDITGSSLTGSYSTQTITKTIGTTAYNFEFAACVQSSMCQLRDNATLSYIKIPELPGVIKSIATTECSNSGNPASNYSGTLHFKSSKTRGNSDTDDIAKIALSNASSFNWDLSSNTTHSSGWLFTSAGLRIKDLTITYGTETSNYMTTCCQTLGSINGSVSLAQLTTANPTKLKATWTMNAETGIDSYDLEIYDSNDNKVKTIKGYTSGDEITGLTPCTSYYAKLYTVSQGSPYCDGGLISTSTPVSTIGYTLSVGKSNVTLSSGSEPTNICSNVSATYTAATGYALPTSISVTNAGAENTGWTWSNGTLTINKANVTGNVSTTIAGTCITPNITADPASTVYSLNESATPLSVTVEGAGAWCGYQWESKVDNGNWTPIQNATSSSYTPSTASAGTTLYRVIVSNTASGCSVSTTSGEATITVSAQEVCAEPKFSIAEGTKLGAQSITLSCDVDDATIYYTTNGDDPQERTEDLYDGSAIAVNQTTTIKAIAAKSGTTTSAVVSATYTIQCKAPTANVSAGTYNVEKSVELSSEYGTVYYTTDGSDPASGTVYNGAIAVSQTTTIRAIAKRANCENSEEFSATYTLKCATPTFSVAAGTHTGAQDVELSCTTDGAAIHYTTNGNDPTGSSPAYSEAIAVSSAQTIKAIATKSGWSNSDVAEAAYTIQYAVKWYVGGTEEANVVSTTYVNAGSKVAPIADRDGDAIGTCATDFMGWTTSALRNGSVPQTADHYTTLFKYETASASLPTITENTSYYAVFASDGGQVETNNYAKITSTTDLADGMKFVLVAKGSKTVSSKNYSWSNMMNNSITSNVLGKNDVTVSNDAVTLTNGDAGCVYTLEASGDNYKIKDKDGKYIYKSSSSSNYIGLTPTASIGREFSISFTSGNAAITMRNCTANDSVLCYNHNVNNGNANPRFSIYKTQIDAVMIFKVQTEQGYSGYVTECAAVEAPTFSVAAGTYNEAQSVELSCATENATIKYTTDETEPSKTVGTEYTAPIAVNQSMTIKAIAIKGDDESDVAEAAYVLQIVTPTISGTANFVNSTTVTIEATGADAIYYTDDNSDPASSDTKKTYSAPFSVESTKTIKAIAVKSNWTSSEVATQTFTKITPLTVAQANTAIAALSANGTIANQYVKGLISQIDKFNEDNTITYYISDNGTTASQLQVYHGSAGVANNGNAFTAKENLQLGEEVIVSGTLKKYEKSTNNYVYEFDKPNSIVAYKTHSPIAWSANAYTAELGGSENEFPTLSGTTGLTISYSSSDETVATISADGTTYDLKKTGETTITATSAATNDFVATTKSYTLTVSPTVIRVDLDIDCNGATSGCPETTHLVKQTSLPNPLPEVTKAGKNFGGWYTDNTFETPAVAGAALTENTTIYAQWLEPYTVARALEIISGLDDDEKTADNVYVAGVVTADAVSIDNNNTATYKIKDATVNNSLEVYKGKGLNNADVAAGDLQEGDQVVVYGQLMKYKGYSSTTKPEIVNPNHLYSKVRPTFDVTGVSVSPTAVNTRVGRTVELTKTIQPANASDKAVTWSSDAEGVATVDENGVVTGVAEGTAHITVTTHDGEFQATCTVTVAGALPTFTEDDHEWIKVSNASKLVAGRFYVIGVGAKGVTATNDLSGGYLDKVSSTFSEDKSVIASGDGDLGANTAIFELGGNSTDGWTLYELMDEENTGYLSGTTSSNLEWSESATTTPISFDEDGNAVLGNGNGFRVLYNNSNPRFKPYSGAQTSMSVPQLYMWAELSHSVTFDANGGVAESVPDVERTDEGKIIIPATTPTHSDISKAFGGWYKSDAPATLYNAGDEFETNVDVTLYAKWNTVPTYTVTYVPGGQGTVPAVASYRAGQKVQVEEASLSNPGYSFAGWTVKDADQNVLPLDEENKFEMPASAVTITAVWSRISSQKWKLVEQGDELVIDAEYVIAYNSNTVQKALGAISSSVGTAINVTIDGDYLKGSEAMKVLTLKKGKDDENYAFKNGDNYLTWSSGKTLNESTTLDNASSWTIEIDENNKVDIRNVGTTARYLQYNASSPRFACYEKTQQKVLLFKKVANLIVEDEQTKTAAQVDASDITVKKDGKLTINVDAEGQAIGDITVEDGGELIIAGSKHIKVNNVYISSTMASGKSSQMSGALAQLDIQGEVYFDITLGDNGNPDHWHAFTVPFPVDAINGIYDLDGNKLVNEVNYAIMDYHGDIRATGNYGWKKYRKTLVPGTFYLMTVDGLRTTYRFKKTADGALVAGNTKALTAYSGGGAETDQGWNGVGNPTMVYGTVDQKVQVLNPSTYTYEQFLVGAKNFVVGTPFFVQATTDGTMTMGAVDGEKPYYAPARVQANEIKDIEVTFGNEEYKDRLYISSSEDALNRYETGKDLAKMTMTSTPKVAQIFGKAYNSKLCMVYTPLVNNQAEVALELYAPQAGEYTIAAPAMENANLYLTYEGAIIWNLSMGEYELDLNKGTTNGYGLLLQAKAPQVTTGVDEVDAETGVQKVIIDEHVFILRGGQMYDVTGKMVK